MLVTGIIIIVLCWIIVLAIHGVIFNFPDKYHPHYQDIEGVGTSTEDYIKGRKKLFKHHSYAVGLSRPILYLFLSS